MWVDGQFTRARELANNMLNRDKQMNETKRIFGIRQVGFFVATLIIENDGFVYKGNKYGWKDIITIKRSDTFADNLGRFPSTIILLSDGNIIRLPITLEEKKIKESLLQKCMQETE